MGLATCFLLGLNYSQNAAVDNKVLFDTELRKGVRFAIFGQNLLPHPIIRFLVEIANLPQKL